MAVALVALLLFVQQPLLKDSSVATAATPDLRCGAMCLYVGLRGIDVPVASFESIEKKLGPASSMGYSMDQLRSAAEEFGAHALPIQTNLENLRKRRRPFACIAHLTTGHFVLIGDVTNDSVYVINPPQSAANVPVATFLLMWDQRVLVLAREPVEPEERFRKLPTGLWIWSAILATVTIVIWGSRFFRRRNKGSNA